MQSARTTAAQATKRAFSSTPENVPLIIAGQKRVSTSADFFPVHNPATGELIAKTPLATQAEMQEAVDSAKDAYKTWKNIAPSARARVMHKFEGAIRDSTDELAAIITREQGKTTADAQGDVFRGLEVVEQACGIPGLMMGETLHGIGGGVDCQSWR